jgi:hypothetical protein
MKRISGRSVLIFGLILLSAALYAAHYFFIGHDLRFIIDWFFGSIAFLPISIIGVTIIFQSILALREKQVLMNKLNMVIGAFFSEAGSGFIKTLVKYVRITPEISGSLMISGTWGKSDFSSSAEKLRAYDFGIDGAELDLECLMDFLASKKDFMLRLLENQNLLEHETFTDLLWAVFHVSEELESRSNLKKLSVADMAHISIDIRRAYTLAVVEWLGYMSHLKDNYPYLFSLAVRKNPFDKNAKVEIAE